MADNNNDEKYQMAPDVYRVETPCLGHYTKLSVNGISPNSIFRISKKDLMLMFAQKNLKMPDNQGEIKTSLNILKDIGYSYGLC
jgi:hypothetical protein